ncbi:MAG: hypothetical protein WC595_00250 [Candidatus Nanoarchaeia archaeon]
MQVNIKFDTEKETLDDLRRLVASLQDLISQREKIESTPGFRPAMQSIQMTSPVQNVQQSPPRPVSNSGQTSGGGKIMEYDPAVGDLLSKFASGK